MKTGIYVYRGVIASVNILSLIFGEENKVNFKNPTAEEILLYNKCR